MSANTLYLLRIWAFFGVMLVFAGTQFAASLAYGRVWTAVLPLAFAAAVVVYTRLRNGDRRLRRLLQADSPEPLVNWYRKLIRPRSVPDGDAILAQCCATAYALYADYPSARAALASVSWADRPPILRACPLILEALLCYFDTREYQRGHDLAASAAGMALVNPAFPGARRGAEAAESYVEVGQVLCGRATDATVANLGRKFPTLRTLDRLVVAWGLAAAYRQRGDAARAEEMLTYLREVAPHCRALALPETV